MYVGSFNKKIYLKNLKRLLKFVQVPLKNLIIFSYIWFFFVVFFLEKHMVLMRKISREYLKTSKKTLKYFIHKLDLDQSCFVFQEVKIY
jgi:hypothetical protein